MRLSVRFCSIIVLLLLALPVVVSAAPRPFDVMLVLDESRSMLKTDPSFARREAATLFLHLCGPNQQVGVVDFSTTVRQAREPRSMGPGKHRDKMLQVVRDTRSEGDFTDIETALREAAERLTAAGDKSHRRAVILMTDGKVDIGSPEADAKSVKSLRGALARDYAAKGIELYCIAYSDQADSDLLGALANATQGLCIRGDKSADLRPVFMRIFENLAHPQTVPVSDSKALIDADVREATFFIAHPKTNEPIRLVSPDKKGIERKTEERGVNWFAGSGYDLVTVASPAPGTWGLEPAHPGNDDRVLVLTDLELSCDDPPQTVLAGEDVRIVARLMNGSQAVRTPELLKDLAVNVMVKGTDSEAFPLVSGDGQGVFTGTVTIPETAGACDLEIVAQGPTFQRRIVRTVSVMARWFSVQMEKDVVEPGKPIRMNVILAEKSGYSPDNMDFRARVRRPDGTQIERAATPLEGSSCAIAVDDTTKTGDYAITVISTLKNSPGRVLRASVSLAATVGHGAPSPALPPVEPTAAPKSAEVHETPAPVATPVAAVVAPVAAAPRNPALLWVETGILIALLAIAGQLSVFLFRGTPTPSDTQQSMAALRKRAAEITARDEAAEQHLRQSPPPKPAVPVMTVAAAPVAIAEMPDVEDTAPESEPEDLHPSSFGEMESQVLVEITNDSEPESDTPAPRVVADVDADEIIEKLSSDEESLLAEIMGELDTPAVKAETPQADEPAAPEITVEPSGPQTSEEQGLSAADADLLADIAGVQTSPPAPDSGDSSAEQATDEMSDGIPTIPDENDTRSDQDAIDDILNQIVKLTK